MYFMSWDLKDMSGRLKPNFSQLEHINSLGQKRRLYLHKIWQLTFLLSHTLRNACAIAHLISFDKEILSYSKI